MYDDFSWVSILHDQYLADMWDAYCEAHYQNEWQEWQELKYTLVIEGMGL